MKQTIVVVSIIASFTLSSPALSQSLQEAVQKTINENPEVQAAKDERLAADKQIDQARASFFPVIDAAAGYGFEQVTNPTTRGRVDEPRGTVQFGREEGSIQFRQLLFDGLGAINEVERHESIANSRAYALFGRAEITSLNAVQAYLNVQRRETLLKVAQESLAYHTKVHDQIRLRSEQGIGKRADVEQSIGRLSLAERNLRSEEGNLKDAQTNFQRIVGVLPNQLQPVPAEPGAQLPASIDQAVELAVANHPILKSANSDVDSAFSQHETAKAAYFPRLDFEGGVTHLNNLNGNPGRNDDLIAILRVRYNIYNGGKDTARREETAHLINQAKDIRDNTYRQVVESMRLSWVAHLTVKSQLEFFKAHYESSQKALEAYQLQFNIGQRTLLDLLDSANESFTAQSALINAEFDERFAAYRILASMGSLNQSLKVSLPQEASITEN